MPITKAEIEFAAHNHDRESSKENQQFFVDGAEWGIDATLNRVCDFVTSLAQKYTYVNKVTGEAEIDALTMFKHMYYAVKAEE